MKFKCLRCKRIILMMVDTSHCILVTVYKWCEITSKKFFFFLNFICHYYYMNWLTEWHFHLRRSSNQLYLSWNTVVVMAFDSKIRKTLSLSTYCIHFQLHFHVQWNLVALQTLSTIDRIFVRKYSKWFLLWCSQWSFFRYQKIEFKSFINWCRNSYNFFNLLEHQKTTHDLVYTHNPSLSTIHTQINKLQTNKKWNKIALNYLPSPFRKITPLRFEKCSKMFQMTWNIKFQNVSGKRTWILFYLKFFHFNVRL